MTEISTTEPTRGPHHCDTLGDGRQVRRTIRNHCSFKLPGQDWQETKPLVEADSSLVGNFVPLKKHDQAPLQSYLGDALDADYQAAASCRLSDDPDISIDMRPLDALPSRMVELPDSTFKFPGVWTNATKLYRPAPDKLLGTLRLERPGHPETFKYTLDVPDGMHIEFLPDENRARILDSEGIERLHILAPQGWDSSTVNPESPDGRSPVRVSMLEIGTVRVAGRDCIVVELVPNKDDLARATYPVSIEKNPTVQITGTTDIDDNYLYAFQPTANKGTATTLYMRTPGSGHEQRPIIRISAGSIPAGAITGFRLFSYTTYCTFGGTIYAHQVADANDWGELTSTWNLKDGVSPWAGQVGCKLSGKDFDADGSPPSLTFTTANRWYQFNLKPEWPGPWRDGGRLPNGIIFSITNGVDQYRMQSTEYVTYPLYFEIDYEEAGSSVAYSIPRRIAE